MFYQEVGSMGVGAGLYMYDVVVEKFTFAISSPDEFLLTLLSLATEISFISFKNNEMADDRCPDVSAVDTQDHSAGDRTGTVRMPMGCIFAQPVEYE